ncbi:MAG: anthranilate synthase component I family protein [Pirellulales bacterium]
MLSVPPFRPLVERLDPAPSAVDVFRALSHRPHSLFLDSAQRDARLGRYSFVTADPFDFITAPAGSGCGLEGLAQRMSGMQAATVAGLPPFQGGAAGLFGYDLNRDLERLPAPVADEFHVPALAIGLYDVVVAFDHQEKKAWIVSQGFPETDPHARRCRAKARVAQVRGWLQEDHGQRSERSTVVVGQLLKQDELGAVPAAKGPDGLRSSFTKEAFCQNVRRVLEYIHAGDVFQVNLSQRLLFPCRDDSVALYLRLRSRNAAPFAAYFDLGDFQLCSASPERFLRVDRGHVEARPIKGTRSRMWRPEADLFAASDLEQSEKDRAENVMIVDLLRNDLSRTCRPESVHVAQLCGLERYAFVQHLVSVVRGRLRSGMMPLDLLRTSFPGGSITGAPKIRAMEIIAELEPVARGAYCGSVGYVGFDASLDTSILIRTITAGAGWWQFPVGGGIVAQSVPEQEYEETWHKAEGMLRALMP